jgi:hypothetical protein
MKILQIGCLIGGGAPVLLILAAVRVTTEKAMDACNARRQLPTQAVPRIARDATDRRIAIPPMDMGRMFTNILKDIRLCRLEVDGPVLR